MNKESIRQLGTKLIFVGALAVPSLAQAQYFNIPGNGDLMAGFRKTGAHQGTNEMVVYLDNVTNLIKLPMNSTVTLKNLTATGQTDAFSSDLTFLQWSVFGGVYLGDPWNTSLGTFPHATIWYTLPRTNSAVPSVPKPRIAATAQSGATVSMESIGNGANYISSILPGGTNAANNTTLVVEPYQKSYSQFYLTTFMGDPSNPTLGDLGGASINFNIEQTTPSPFTSTSRADLYESAPAPGGRPGNLTYYPDPITGSTTSVYYVGHFDLSPTGVLTFTREPAGTQVTPPPPPSVNVAFNTSTSTISFGTTNGATYTVVYTNFSGLTAPRSSWPVLGAPIIGNGGTASVQDSFSPEGRVYSVIAH
ncbi:MAG TPA: hypothetical protein VFE51_04135 [Verrucomicrobiae bacterium]|nr:hypothetical protein [Verrucomicrobiae bacterium]